MGLYIREVIGEMLPTPAVEITTDSRSLLALATSIQELEECLNKVDLAAIREEFGNGTLNAAHWSPGPKLLADALTKDNRVTTDLLQAALMSGEHIRPLDTITTLGRRPCRDAG